MINENELRKLWNELYEGQHQDHLESFLAELTQFAVTHKFELSDPLWYKDAVIYSLYVDLFAQNFAGLEQKLDYLKDLGVDCLWLLPILDSPMNDAGFDIRRYDRVRLDLLGLAESSSDEERQAVFRRFLKQAKERSIKVIFDIAINHTSIEHEWFQSSRRGEGSPYRDYYIWNKDDQKYKDCRLLFKGMCPSNWEKDGDGYFFHRFFEFQPDLNYRNPAVLIAMVRNFLYWIGQGVDGFRADAIPYLWKEEGTNCENLPKTHTIIKFFRATLDSARPGTLLLAEACQPPREVVKYFGSNDECHAGYHFPLMPQIFKALGEESRSPIKEVLSPEVTPQISESAQWFLFLRCHDELTLEMVTSQEREFIHSHYCHDPRWDFRVGEGIAARLSELFKKDPQKIGLAYSVMLTLPGTPIIYYGDEFGKLNDEDYYRAMKEKTGKNDTRYFVRGKVDWAQVNKDLANGASFAAQVFARVKKQLQVRRQLSAFGKGAFSWVEAQDASGAVNDHVLCYQRSHEDRSILVLNNLSSKTQTIRLPAALQLTGQEDLLGQPLKLSAAGEVTLAPLSYHWCRL
jgi:maltose alpha-D-glucosyltransferase/alpha-amylase